MAFPGIQRWLRPVTIALLCAAALGTTDLFAAHFPVEHDLPLRNPGKGWVMIDHAVPGSIDAARSVVHQERWCGPDQRDQDC
jgi:hypothetical protein